MRQTGKVDCDDAIFLAKSWTLTKMLRGTGSPGDTLEQAIAEVSGPPITDANQRPCSSPSGSVWYPWHRRNGTWTSAVSGGWNPQQEPEKFHPYMAEANIGPNFPPTVLVS